MKKKLMKKIMKDMKVVQESITIFKDATRIGAVKELLLEIKTGNTTISVKNLKGGIHL